MVEHVERVTTVADTEPVSAPATQQVREVREVSRTDRSVSGSTLAARIIWYIAAILLVLLAFRFVLALLGANPSNGFANFIYNVSQPFVSPFFGLFGYKLSYGVARFETYTLVAMAVYALVAFGLSRLTTINKVDRTAE